MTVQNTATFPVTILIILKGGPVLKTCCCKDAATNLLKQALCTQNGKSVAN
jgi:hypothetical protein